MQVPRVIYIKNLKYPNTIFMKISIFQPTGEKQMQA